MERKSANNYMSRTSKKRLQRKALRAFVNNNFQEAFQLYERAYWIDTQDLDTLIGIYLSDMAMDYRNDALNIFDLYQNAVSCHPRSQRRNVQSLILDVIKLFDNKINNDMREIEEGKRAVSTHYDMLDAMSFDELKLMLESSDFKDAFNYVLTNTKLILYKKSDFYEFLSLLVQNDYLDMSMHYIDNLPRYDKEIIPIIEEVNRKLETRRKEKKKR